MGKCRAEKGRASNLGIQTLTKSLFTGTSLCRKGAKELCMINTTFVPLPFLSPFLPIPPSFHPTSWSKPHAENKRRGIQLGLGRLLEEVIDS